MELICSSDEYIRAKVKQIEEYCRRNDITVNIQVVSGLHDIRALQIDDKTYTVFILDDSLVKLLENCGRTVSRMLKITSKPNKLIYMKCVSDDKMEMFDALYMNCATSEEELIKLYGSKSPAEFDETTNTCATFQSLGIQPVDSLSKSSLNESIVVPNFSLQPERHPVESGHTFHIADIPQEQKQTPYSVQRSKSDQNINIPSDMIEQEGQEVNRRSLPHNFQSVETHNLYPNLSVLTSYVEGGISHSGCGLQSHTSSRPLNNSVGVTSGMRNDQLPIPLQRTCLSSSGETLDSSGPYAMPCLSGHGHNCRCHDCPSIQHSASHPGFYSSHPKSLMESDRRSHTLTNDMNFNNFRPEILAMNRQYMHVPSYTPNIQTDGSDNRTLSCNRCGHSVIPKLEQSYIGPSSGTFHSAGGASGMTDKDYLNDKRSIWEFTENVMEMIRDSLDCADYYNWKKLADLHKWSFGKIYQLEQKWKNRKIESPFMHLIEEFQHYTLYDLKEDLRQIPRKDLLQKLEHFEMKGQLFHS